MIRPELDLQIAKQRIEDMVRDAAQRRLLHPSPRTTWLTQQIRGLLRRLGGWLIRIGQLLQQQTDCCEHERLIP